jgi:lysophospholipase L1-like esterase
VNPAPSRLLRSALGVAVLVIAALGSSCAPAVGGLPPAVLHPELPAGSWWAFGDSLFAGVGWQHLGAPSFIGGMENRAVAGHTLVALPFVGPQLPTVRSQIARAIERDGVPDHVVIHAGGADLLARVVRGTRPSIEEYGGAYRELDSWLRDLGVDVWWTSVAPFAPWSIPGSNDMNGVRLQMNDWLRTNMADQLIDCEADLVASGGAWLDERYVLPGDGVHLNGAGASAHARCIARALEAVALP